MTQVLALDPGKMTGWAAWAPGVDGRPQSGQDEFFDVLERTDRWMAAVGHDGIVVVERYTISKSTLEKSRQSWSLEVIGTVKFLANRHGVELVMQQPSDAKSFVPDSRLRDVGWYVRGQDHARDALRHLLLFLTRRGMVDLPRLLGIEP